MSNGATKSFEEITFADLREIENEITTSDRAAIDLLVHPRTFFIQRGYLLPAKAEITMTPTEERKARFFTKDGVLKYFSKKDDPSFGKIKIHVIDGIGKCVRIEIDCPCPIATQFVAPRPSKNIITSLTLHSFHSIVTEAQGNDAVLSELVADPRNYFEGKGYYAPPGILFRTMHTKKWVESLNDETKINSYFENEPALAKVYHISKGKGECTHIEVTCDCPTSTK